MAAHKTESRVWVWRFDHPPDRVWPILADTARWNEAAALPNHQTIDVLQEDGSVHYLATLKAGPFTIKWREIPIEWVTEQQFRHCREFFNGPFKSLCATLEIVPDEAGSRVDYTLDIIPANLLGRLMIRFGFMENTGKTFAKLTKSVAAHLAGETELPYGDQTPSLPTGARRRIAAMVEVIEQTPYGHGLAQRLADHILKAQETDLLRIRPRALARLWSLTDRPVIECCLEAVKAGLLEMTWDLLCPRCKGAKETVSSLDKLPTGAHCGSCNIDYDRDFSKNVELSFRPSATVRPLESGEFCLFGPMTTPHVKVQQTLAPGQSVELEAGLDYGEYRLRLLEPGGEADIDWLQGGFPEVIAGHGNVSAGAAAPPGRVRLTNNSDRELTAIVESRSWASDALTADRVTAMQSFRDLFSDVVLRPGDEVGISNVTLMFTDLKNSTEMYSRIGDAAAFYRVREHFSYLSNEVRTNNGAVVKTIGDAVMAAFADPADGVRAAIAIQHNVARLNEEVGGEELIIKIGLHCGHCIAVTLNDRLDYFGSTVNLCARLQGESLGTDVVISHVLADDPAVGDLLRDMDPEEEVALIRGVRDPVRFFRLTQTAIDAT